MACYTALFLFHLASFRSPLQNRIRTALQSFSERAELALFAMSSQSYESWTVGRWSCERHSNTSSAQTWRRFFPVFPDDWRISRRRDCDTDTFSSRDDLPPDHTLLQTAWLAGVRIAAHGPGVGKRNPLGVDLPVNPLTQGSLLHRQPWATRRNPVGVRWTVIPSLFEAAPPTTEPPSRPTERHAAAAPVR